MIRISTIFIAICMVLISASLGLILYSVTGLGVLESALAALAALTFLILYNAVATRLRDRRDVGGQIADLSRGTADLARQVTEFGRRMAAIETRLSAAEIGNQDRIQSVTSEIGELGSLVRQLAVSVAGHDDILTAAAAAASAKTTTHVAAERTYPEHDAAEPAMPPAVPPPAAAPAVPIVPAAPAPDILGAVQNAIAANRIDLYLQPIVSLPQRKVRFYEAVSRLRDDNDQILNAGDFITTAEASGLIGQIDYMVMFRCVQVLRRLQLRNTDVGLFCNVSAATLASPDVFAQCLDFLEANRSLAPSLVFEFKHATLRNLAPVQSENLATLARLGFTFSVDNIADLRIDGRRLADCGVRYIKVPARLLLDHKQASSGDIHAADLSSLMARFGIDLIAERIEGERAVVDLLDYDVRFGQGFLFSRPRPLRPEGAAQTAPATQAAQPAPSSQPDSAASAKVTRPSTSDQPVDNMRLSGNAALVRRAARS